MNQSLCESCQFAEWDHEEFYDCTGYYYFVSGCKVDPQHGKTDADGNVVDCERYWWKK